MDPIKKQKFISIVRNMLISGFLTSIFMYLVYIQRWQSVAAGMFIGGFIYLAVYFYYSSISDRYLRRVNLILVLVVNTISNLLIMLVIAWVGIGLFYMGGNFKVMVDNIGNIFGPAYLIGLSFGLVLGFIFNFLGIVNTLIGRKILGKLFIGKYRQPSEVEHAFMFLDIRSSTAIAEKTGPRRFMSLVNDFFHDIALPVAATKGEIYKYIGDGVIITWEMRDALMDANCLRCFAGIREIIQARKDHYLEKYGLVPEFGAGLHGGTVTTGELGYTRREIAFMGDVLNTTARIEEACKKHKAGLLVSEYLMEKLEVPKEMQVRSVGIEVLRGKTEEIKLSEVIPTDQSPAP